MKNIGKRVGSILLVLCLLFTIGPMQALAADRSDDSDTNTYVLMFGASAGASNGNENTDQYSTNVNTDVGGVIVYASDGGEAAYEVKDSVTAKYVAAQVIATEDSSEYGDADATLIVENNVTANAKEAGTPSSSLDLVGVNIFSEASDGNANANVYVGGNVAANDPYEKNMDVLGLQAKAVSSDEGNANIFATVGGNVSAVGSGDDEVNGAFIKAVSNDAGNAEVSAKVGGNVEATLTGEDGYTVLGAGADAVSHDTGSATASLEVGGDVKATSPWAATAVEAYAVADGKAEAVVTVEGAAIATADGYNAVGVTAVAGTDDGSNDAIASVTIGNGVSASSNGEYSQSTGVQVWIEPLGGVGDSTANVTVTDGGVNATGYEADGVNALIWNDGSGKATGTVAITGDLTADAQYEANGVFVVSGNGTMTVSVDGTVNATAGEKAVGINADDDFWAELTGAAGENGKISVSAKGVNASAGEEAMGAYISSSYGGSFDTLIGEDGITAKAAEATGAYIGSYCDSTATLEVEGDVTALASEDQGIGVFAWAADGAAVNVSVVGVISATAENDEAYALGVEGYAYDGGNVTISAGEIQAEGAFAIGADLMAGEDASVTLLVNGDLSGELAGLVIEGVEDDGAIGLIDALVEGTLSGGAGSVVITSEEVVDGATLTIWQAELNEDGHIVGALEYGEEDEMSLNYSEATEKLEKNILYIIKYEDPLDGKVLSVADENGGALNKSHEYDVANESDKVILKIDLPEGYRLTGAFNGTDDKTPLLQDENGNYYVIVPKGGGVFLTVTLEEIPAPEPEPEPEPEPVPEPEPEPEPAPAPAPEPIPEPDQPEGTEANVILTVSDEEEAITIRFYDDLSYVAELADGRTEAGYYKLDEGKIVLVANGGAETEIDEDGKLVYAFNNDGELSFTIVFEADELAILQAALN